MAMNAKQPTAPSRGVSFPPEASCEFDVVPVEEIDEWREKLNERFGIGRGKLRSLDVVPAS